MSVVNFYLCPWLGCHDIATGLDGMSRPLRKAFFKKSLDKPLHIWGTVMIHCLAL